MAIDFGDNNASRHYSVPHHADLQFPAGDWCLGFTTIVQDNSGSLYQYVFSNNQAFSQNSLNVLIRESGLATEPNRWSVTVGDSLSATFEITAATATVGVYQERLIVVQRRSNTLELWLCLPGGTATLEASIDATAMGEIIGNGWIIGGRYDLNVSRFYEEHLGNLFKGNISLPQASIERIASGEPAWRFGTMQAYFALHRLQTTERNLLGPQIATRIGTGYPIARVSFSPKKLIPVMFAQAKELPFSANNIEYRYSGGLGNTDGDVSLGGVVSTGKIIDVEDLFDAVSAVEAASGDTEYRCFYVKNTHSLQALSSAEIWVNSATPSGDTHIELGIGTAAIGAIEQTIANEQTAPSSVTFDTAVGQGNALSLGNIPAQSFKAVWVKRVVGSNTTPVDDDAATIRVSGLGG